MAAPAKKPFSIQQLWPVAAIALALALVFVLDLDRFFTLDAIKQNRDALKAAVAENYGLAVLAFMAVYAAAVAVSIPGASILSILGGMLFGLWGTIPTVIGATVGATIVFFIAKTALGDALRGRVGGALARFEQGFKDGEFSYLLVLRLVPLFPFWMVNVVPAFLNANPLTYVLATLVGIVPGVFVYTSIGAGADAVFAQGRDLELAGVMTKPEILIPIVGLILLALVPVAYKRFARRA